VTGRPTAAVDVGTNSVRLLVRGADGARRTRELTITRLGQGVDATGRLHPDALERTLATIERYAAIWRDHGVEDAVRIASTSAVRDAANRDEFFAGVRRVTGVDAEVLSGEEEAGLAFAGAAGAVDVAAPDRGRRPRWWFDRARGRRRDGRGRGLGVAAARVRPADRAVPPR
jgi:exopolyphosphatase / guanosine-5'-triphosphate,3'-diphosphate pyrophosphatase